MKKILLPLLLVLTFSCANKYIESKPDNQLILNSSPTFKGHFYLGSDSTHHYFTSKWKYGKDNRFKIKKSDLSINAETALNSKEISLWVTNPDGFNLKEFCKIKSRVIYQPK